MGNGFTGLQGDGSEYNVDVVIIGAGPAGLTAGYLLSKKGLKVAIIEKDTRYVGGISRTVEHEAIGSTSAATASSRSRSRSSTCGTRSCPTTSSSARA